VAQPGLERAPQLCDADERVLDETMVHSLDTKADLSSARGLLCFC
jgi:hypothetical protein